MKNSRSAVAKVDPQYSPLWIGLAIVGAGIAVAGFVVGVAVPGPVTGIIFPIGLTVLTIVAYGARERRGG